MMYGVEIGGWRKDRDNKEKVHKWILDKRIPAYWKKKIRIKKKHNNRKIR